MAATNQPMIQQKNVSKIYDNGTVGLKDINLNIDKGEFKFSRFGNEKNGESGSTDTGLSRRGRSNDESPF